MHFPQVPYQKMKCSHYKFKMRTSEQGFGCLLIICDHHHYNTIKRGTQRARGLQALDCPQGFWSWVNWVKKCQSRRGLFQKFCKSKCHLHSLIGQSLTYCSWKIFTVAVTNCHRLSVFWQSEFTAQADPVDFLVSLFSRLWRQAEF